MQWFAYVQQAIAVTYAHAYGRFGVLDTLRNYSFAGTAGGVPAPLAPDAEAIIFGTSNGIPPTGGVSLINNAAPGGAKEDRISTPDQDLDGALCLRSLAMRSDEICMVSVARSGVLVKASKKGIFRRRSVGFFAAVLYNETNVYKAAQTAHVGRTVPRKESPRDVPQSRSQRSCKRHLAMFQRC